MPNAINKSSSLIKSPNAEGIASQTPTYSMDYIIKNILVLSD